MDFRLTIPGNPEPWQVQVRNAARTLAYERRIAWQAQVRAHLLANWQQEPLSGPVVLDVDFFLPWPQNAPQKRREAIEKYHDTHWVMKPDVDNLKKAFSDACEGILYHGDQQIVAGEPKKHLLNPNIYKNCREGYTEIRFRPYST